MTTIVNTYEVLYPVNFGPLEIAIIHAVTYTDEVESDRRIAAIFGDVNLANFVLGFLPTTTSED